MAGTHSADACSVAVQQLLVGYASLAGEEQLQYEQQLESCVAEQMASSDTAAKFLSSQLPLQQHNRQDEHIGTAQILLVSDVSFKTRQTR